MFGQDYVMGFGLNASKEESDKEKDERGESPVGSANRERALTAFAAIAGV